MTAWEYKVIHLADWGKRLGAKMVQQQLNEAGKDGWEVATDYGDRIVLKRALPWTPEPG